MTPGDSIGVMQPFVKGSKMIRIALICLFLVGCSQQKVQKMPVLGKDDLHEASSGVVLTAHAPSGSGATGGSWVAGVASFYVAPVSRVSNTGFKSSGASTGNSYLNGSGAIGASAPAYAQCDITFGNDTGYAGPLLAKDALSATGSSYALQRQPGAWRVIKSSGGSNTTLGTPGASFSTGTPYTLRLERTVSGSTASLTAIINGVSYGPYTDSSSAFVGTVYGGISTYDASHANTAITNFESGGIAVSTATPDVTADHSSFNYLGRWVASGTEKRTITNGSSCEFTYVGNTCTLCFDISASGIIYPGIAYSVDGAAWTRATLDGSGSITVTPTYNTAPSGSPPFASVRSNVHRVRFLANIESGYPTSHDNWSDQRDALRFTGVYLNGGSLLSMPVNPSQIEFLGDSITAGLRLLYTSAGTDTIAVNAPELNWTEYCSRSLGLAPVVTGHGGQGITTTATNGTPIANTAFGLSYSGAAYSPTYNPTVVVIYQGTNDSAISQAQYQTYLTTVRAAYPDAYVFSVVPFLITGTRRTNILAAVTAQVDAKIFALDYSAAFTASTDTSDGTHFNPGGAVRMGAKLATDIQSQLNTLGVKVQAAGSGTATNTDEWDQLRAIARSNGLELIVP